MTSLNKEKRLVISVGLPNHTTIDIDVSSILAISILANTLLSNEEDNTSKEYLVIESSTNRNLNVQQTFLQEGIQSGAHLLIH